MPSLFWTITIPILLILIGYMRKFDFNPKSRKLTFTNFEGPLSYNELLNSAEKLFEGQILGPESLAVYEGNIYSGLGNGDIVKFTGDNKFEVVTKIGKKCEGYWQSHLCGRPLGCRFDKTGKLYVADAVFGIHSVDVKSGIVTPLLTTNRIIEDRPMVFPDDLTIDEAGIIYITDASGKWNIDDVLYCAGEYENSGRVIQFNPKTNEVKVIMKDLVFPNGIQVSAKNDFLLVAELSKRRILRYYLKGTKKGTHDIFVDNLPGEPDNIRLSSNGGFWVAIALARNDTHRMLVDHFDDYPFAIKYLSKLFYSIGCLMEYVAQFLPYPRLREIAFQVKSGQFSEKLVSSPAMIIELSSEGKILRNFYSTGENIRLPSEILEHNKHLYIGSFMNNYLGRLKL